ncbi:MAG TPA: hypothetical protein VEK34_10875 [Methylocella sp.]|nr:hypothetical protein [Methylocella sp.]
MTIPPHYFLAEFFFELCVIGAVSGSLYLLLAAYFVLRFRGRHDRREVAAVPVTILKPLHGEEPNLYSRLSTFCEQSYPGPVQIVFGCHDESDPAVARN